jgi:glycosyltransferase involved in cell wall biosynthesis
MTNPRLSVVIPCYNEESELPISMPPLLEALSRLGISHEVILVNNGSSDRTGELIDALAGLYPVRRVEVPVNQGYGFGITQGMRAARGSLVCQMWADAQVSPDDVVQTIEIALATQPGTIVKVRRSVREDGFVRKLISLSWNGLFQAAFAGGGLDVNGCPKIYHREDLACLALEKKDSFLDAEAMVKAGLLGLRVIEVPVRFFPRARGSSKIKLMRYSASFVRNVFEYRFGPGLAAWKAQQRTSPSPDRNSLRAGPVVHWADRQQPVLSPEREPTWATAKSER